MHAPPAFLVVSSALLVAGVAVLASDRWASRTRLATLFDRHKRLMFGGVRPPESGRSLAVFFTVILGMGAAMSLLLLVLSIVGVLKR